MRAADLRFIFASALTAQTTNAKKNANRRTIKNQRRLLRQFTADESGMNRSLRRPAVAKFPAQ